MAGRWPGTHAATAAAKLQGWRPAQGCSHLSLQIEYVAVMIHLMRGAGEPLGSLSSSFMPGARANLAACLAPHAARSKSPQCCVHDPRAVRGPGPRFENERTTKPARLVFSAASRQLRFVHVETNRRIGAWRAPWSLRAVWAASSRLRAHSHASASAAGRRIRR